MIKTYYYTQNASYTLGYIITTIPPEELIKRVELIQRLEKEIEQKLKKNFSSESHGYSWYDKLRQAVSDELKSLINKEDMEVRGELLSIEMGHKNEAWLYTDINAVENKDGYYLQREFMSDMDENTLIHETYCA